MAASDLQRKVNDYHVEIGSGGHHGGHNMHSFHMQWHQTNRDPVRPARPDPRWGANLVFGTNFLQMHHEMVKARDDEPKTQMMHSSVAAWFQSKGFALPPDWNPTTAIPAAMGYEPDASVFPAEIQSLLADRARQLGVSVATLLTRRTNNPRFVLPGWATRAGIAAGEAPEPVTGARKLADFVNTNQLGCCLVFPHNSWHGAIGGAMSSTATAIADPVFYFGVHWIIDRVYDEFKLILAEREIRGHDTPALAAAAVATPDEDRAIPDAFTPTQLESFEQERIQSAALRELPTVDRTAANAGGGGARPTLLSLSGGTPSAPVSGAVTRGVQELMSVPAPLHDKAWLQEALQNAIQLELTTIPPYLCASWSVINPGDPVATTLSRIAVDEMIHMGLAANMLNAIGGSPQINSPLTVPKYPCEMPFGVHPGLKITLQGITKDVVGAIFMEIEKPDFAPVVTMLSLGETYATIGNLYNAIEQAFIALPPGEITGAKQVTDPLLVPSLIAVTDPASALAAIKKIREEGEGTPTVPTSGTKLAHYYRFGEIYHGKKAVQTPTGWKYTGAPVAFPAVYPVAPVPAGGYANSLDFDKLYSALLGDLQQAWQTGDATHLSAAVDKMYEMADPARTLMQTPLPMGGGNYCPSFVFVP